MSHDEHSEPIIRTSPARLGKGLAIVVITLAVCTAILIPFWDDMVSNPPPVTLISRPPPTEPTEPAPAGTTTIAIPNGAAVQGNPDYDPDSAEVPLGNMIVWRNDDTAPHTATSGTGSSDAESGARFDTGILDAGASSEPIDTADFAVGDVIPYFCMVHPYMTAELTITEAGEGGATGGGAATGPAIEIPAGAAVQGNTAYAPAELTVAQGDVVQVTNSDDAPHTITRGTGFDDPNSAVGFDTSIIDVGASAEIDTSALEAGEYDYYCSIHPYMAGKLTVE